MSNKIGTSVLLFLVYHFYYYTSGILSREEVSYIWRAIAKLVQLSGATNCLHETWREKGGDSDADRIISGRLVTLPHMTLAGLAHYILLLLQAPTNS